MRGSRPDQLTLDVFIAEARAQPRRQPQVHHVSERHRYSTATYVGRRCYGWPETIWGNPYKIGRDGTRTEVVAKFEVYARERLAREPNWLYPLRGKDLLCWCKPHERPCHAEVLLKLLTELDAAAN